VVAGGRPTGKVVADPHDQLSDFIADADGATARLSKSAVPSSSNVTNPDLSSERIGRHSDRSLSSRQNHEGVPDGPTGDTRSCSESTARRCGNARGLGDGHGDLLRAMDRSPNGEPRRELAAALGRRPHGQRTGVDRRHDGAVPYEGDLTPISNDAIDRSLATWGADGVLDATHTTPFGELPGSAVINFVIIDALAHAWDISTALGRPIEFPAEAIPAISAVVAAACTEGTQSMGLFGVPTELPADATETERLMAATGRAVSR
jgi:uncharacterized protein (TIGR03086 family)